MATGPEEQSVTIRPWKSWLQYQASGQCEHFVQTCILLSALSNCIIQSDLTRELPNCRSAQFATAPRPVVQRRCGSLAWAGLFGLACRLAGWRRCIKGTAGICAVSLLWTVGDTRVRRVCHLFYISACLLTVSPCWDFVRLPVWPTTRMEDEHKHGVDVTKLLSPHSSTKYWPISKILSLSHSAINTIKWSLKIPPP